MSAPDSEKAMKKAMFTIPFRVNRAAQLLLGLAVMLGGVASAQNELPLSGPAFTLADQAYKAYAQGDYGTAADKAREAVRLRPDVVSLSVLLRRAEAAQVSPPRVVGGAPVEPRARRGTDARSGRPVPPSRSFVEASAGYKAYDAGEFDAAIGYANRAIDLAPRNLDYRLLLINALAGANRLAEADQAISAAESQVGSTPRLLAQRSAIAQRRAQAPGAVAFAAFERGDAESAIANARSAIRLAPNNSAYRQLLVQALIQGDQLPEAEAAATEAMTLDATDPSPQVLRAYTRQRLGRSMEATADFNQALAQPQLGASARRQIRLIAADAALASGDPQAALTLLKDMPPGADEVADEAVSRRRRAATAQVSRPEAVRAAQTAVSFPAPVLDCSRVDGPQRCVILASGSGGPVEPGFAAAASAYKAYDDGQFAAAADDARRATQLSPANRDYKLLLVSALTRSNQFPEADMVATRLLVANGSDAALLAQRGAIRQQLGQTELAKADFEAALARSAEAAGAAGTGTGQLPVMAQIGLLADVGRKAEARQRFDAALATGASGEFAGVADADVAYLAAKIGDDSQALAAFNRADASGKLSNSAYQDAAYSALRSRQDAQAVAYFKRTIDDVGALKLRMEPQLLFNTRRAVADISREGGVIASLSYRGAVSGLGVAPGAGTDSLQAGVEGYWRPWGYQNGQYVELFARAFQTLYSKGGNKGGDTLQAAVGVRFKPFTEQNLVGSFSRVFSPSGGRNDWLAQLGYSRDTGTDLRVDVPSWWTSRISAEMGRYLQAEQNYALAEFQAGRSFRVGDSDAGSDGRWVIFPHVSLAADYDSTAVEKTTVGLGPGVTARYWFREDKYNAPRSYIDWSMQYRARIGGAERGKGLFLNTTLSY
jgi:tetratricopeptide (TPR) repeat protein